MPTTEIRILDSYWGNVADEGLNDDGITAIEHAVNELLAG